MRRSQPPLQLLPRSNEEKAAINKFLQKIYAEAAEKTEEFNKWRVRRLHPAREHASRAHAAIRAEIIRAYLLWEKNNPC